MTHKIGKWIVLQGLGSPLMARLAEKIDRAGGSALRIIYSGGDYIFKGQIRCLHFRAPFDQLHDFYTRLIETERPNGFILFGDQRPIHIPVIRLAKEKGVTVYVLEEGYLRPARMTLEAFGTNSRSPLPTAPAAIRKLAKEAAADTIKKADTTKLPPQLFNRVWMEIVNRGANIFLAPFYPHYKIHRPYSMATEVRTWLTRLVKMPLARRHRTHILPRYVPQPVAPFYLAPLQLNGDTQIILDPDLGGVTGFIDKTLASFTAHAPAHTRLLFKNHPLDNGLINYKKYIRQKASELGVYGRTDFIEGGDIQPLIEGCDGVILVNSTTGLAALQAGKAVFTFGKAVYTVDGLAQCGCPDTFWTKLQPPDPALLTHFIQLLEDTALIEGDFFTRQGIDIATDAIIQVLSGKRKRIRLSPAGEARLS